MSAQHPPGSPGAWERLRARLPLGQSQVMIGGDAYLLPELLQPEAYIESRLAAGQGQAGDLPYWTKLWPASLALALMMNGLSLPQGGRALELGAGLGLPGLVAARRGLPTWLTDLDPDALEFARAAVELNGLEETAQARSLDWTAPPGDLGRFPLILGAEVLYQPELYPALVELLAGLLAPGGTAFLSHQERPFAITFFDLADKRFTIRSKKGALRGEEGPVNVIIYALKLR